MSLADEIRALRDRILLDLTVAHDYYHDSKYAWSRIQKLIKSGAIPRIRNPLTGTVTKSSELPAKVTGYLAQQLAESTFLQFISIFESFIFDLLSSWLATYPQSLGGKKLDFKSVLDSPDRDTVIQVVVRKEVNEVIYDRPAGWFAYLDDIANLGCPTTNEIAQIAEIKVTRDVLIHNKGVANKTYESKAGSLARSKDGERIDITEEYHRISWKLIYKVVSDVSNAAIAKAPKS